MSSATTQSEEGRTSKINRGSDGEIIGAAVFLSGDQLRDLGIDLDSNTAVRVTVEDGQLQVTGTTKHA